MIPIGLVCVLLVAQPDPRPADDATQSIDAELDAGTTSPDVEVSTEARDAEHLASDAGPTTPDVVSAESATLASVQALHTWAANIRALVDGSLDPSVAAADLFRFTPDEIADTDGVFALLALLGQRQPAATNAGEERGPIEVARLSVIAAQRRFLSLPERVRAYILSAHSARRAAWLAAQRAVGAEAATIARLREEAVQIQQLGDGTLPAEVDPTPLMALDLRDPLVVAALAEVLQVAGLGELRGLRDPIGPSERVPRRWLELPIGDAASTPRPRRGRDAPAPRPTRRGPESGERFGVRLAIERALDTSGTAWSQASAELRAALVARVTATVAFLRRPEPERRAILERHTRRGLTPVSAPEIASKDAVLAAGSVLAEAASREAEAASREAVEAAQQARKEQAAALAAAEQARDEAIRVVAQERARLLGARERLSLSRAALLEQRQAIHSGRASALEWERKSSAVVKALELGQASAGEADDIWEGLNEALGVARAAFDKALTQLEGGARLDSLGDGADLSRVAPSERAAVDALKTTLRADALKNQELELEVLWEAVDAGHYNVRGLNDSRLLLIDYLSSGLRRSATGFGPKGIAQVSGAWEQADLTLRYRVATLPRVLHGLWTDIARDPFAALLAMAQLLIITIAYRWWRRRGRAWLTTRIDAFERLRKPSSDQRFRGALRWYLREVERPLATLIFIALIMVVLGDSDRTTELQLGALVFGWILFAQLAACLVNGVAARFQVHADGIDESSDLRMRSLRVIANTLVAVMLLLSLTSALFGQGALYSWVVRVVWLAIVPVAIVLTGWWANPVFERLSALTQKGSFLRWCERAKSSVLTRRIAVALAGIVLLAEGIWRWFTLRLGDYGFARTIQAWLLRRKVSRHGSSDGDDASLPLAAAVDTALRVAQPSAVVMAVNAGLLKSLAERLASPLGQVTVVVGERGAGKTNVLNGLYDELGGAADVMRVTCPVGGFDQLAAVLATQLDLPPTADERELAEALTRRQLRAVFIDDAHRLIRPVIGGLADIDKLTALVRRVGGVTHWLMTMVPSALQFLSRARGLQPYVDHVARIEPWDDKSIRQWLLARATEAGLTAEFDELVVASGVESGQPAFDVASATRTYFRLLNDYAQGNPGVALFFWRESLCMTAAGHCRVRLFVAPDQLTLDGLPSLMHFVLRAIVQLDKAAIDDVVQATHLRREVVLDAIRHLIGLGCIERDGTRVEVAWRWVRAVTLTLRRQHLMAA